MPPHISNASGDKLARYQSFSDESEANASRTRLKRLRIGLAKAGLDGLLVPRADIFQGEYIPACENRVAFLTGFTGSAGFLIVMRNTAALITDGRYTVQARKQVKAGLVEVVPLAEYNPEGYLRKLAGEGARIGYDPALFTPRGLKRFEKAAHEGGFALVALTTDPVAAIWDGRPAQPATPVFDHPIRVAGEAMAEKITRVQAKLAELRVDALLISETPNVNWLLNIRAGDLPHLPLLRAFLLLPRAGKPVLFCDPQRLSPDVAARFAGAVEVVVPATDGAAELEARLLPLAKAGKRIRLDEESAPVRFARFVEAAGGEADIGADPTFLMKARKNATEMSGARAAHLRDGAAMARFLAWLDREIAAGQTLTEIDAAIRLEAFRIETNALVDISFPSISASGPNAALPHYRPLAKANRRITSGLYLIDSGGQYQDGTTDITRTVMIRRTSGDQKEMFTRVLKGVIAISRAVFPKGTSGAQLDSFARAAIWEAGRDFDHGTGHGVGSFLSVHEGPQRLSKLGTTPLEPGMILSNEPGYYREGAYGIRTENLIIVEPREIPGGERAMFGFETITFCPIDRRLILKAMLNRAERDWLDAYHAETLRKIGPLLAGADLAWLEAACAPL